MAAVRLQIYRGLAPEHDAPLTACWRIRLAGWHKFVNSAAEGVLVGARRYGLSPPGLLAPPPGARITCHA